MVNYSARQLSGDNYPEAIILVGNCPGNNCPGAIAGGNYLEGAVVRGTIIRRAIALFPLN